MNSNFQSKGKKKKEKKKEKRTQDYVIEWNYNTMALWSISTKHLTCSTLKALSAIHCGGFQKSNK